MNGSPKYFVDIGACVGLFIDYCLENYDVAKIYAFEPLRVNYDFLQNKYKDQPAVQVYRQAVSNFNGEASLYKKRYPQKFLGILPWWRYDFAGNAGSSLNSRKSNVSAYKSEMVPVVRFRDLMEKIPADHIDILKIDSEGTEYEILLDMLDSGLYKKIEAIYFEDHVRKIPGLEGSKARFLTQVNQLGIAHKFYLQQDHLTYIPLAHAKNN